ncbi:MAG TPA: RdgB/HAM1 family non-canonical purine NTP pyrophosphatase [Pyrinomonadaceae bacterium]|nr:RdgB/HAM1 family non-canonical purine NTP pyrophosphatase [Pyrinomonadaceae bacterium]
MTKLLIGTGNTGKLREIKMVLGDVPYEIVSLADFDDLETPDENRETYSANAMLKAGSYAKQTGLLALADDSGLEVEALNWGPGVMSARYAGDDASDADRRSLLLSELSKTGSQIRTARFVCAVAIAYPTEHVISLAEGVCEGRINDVARGVGGFGYDPLFVPDGYDLTFAELPDAVKNRISHRGRALAKAREFLLGYRQKT